MANEIVKIDYSDNNVVKTLKQTVAQGATEQEFMMFAEICKATGLNPFKREVWFIKAGGRVQIMTGNQGFHTIANSHPQYDGIETGFVGKDGTYLPMTYPNSDFIGAWAKVYRKDRRIPIEAVAMLNEYDKGQSNWKTMRRIMIVKCAESLALRKSFPQELNGLYTQEEMPSEFAPSSKSEVKVERKFQANFNATIQKTNELMEQGEAYMYDIPKITGKKREQFVELFKSNGCISKDGITYCSREVEEWEEYKVKPIIEIDQDDFDEELAFRSALAKSEEQEEVNI